MGLLILENVSNDYESVPESCKNGETECESDGTEDPSINVDFDDSFYGIAAELVTQVPNLTVNQDPWVESYKTRE